MSSPSFKFAAGLHFSNVQSGDKINTLICLAEFQQTCRQKFYLQANLNCQTCWLNLLAMHKTQNKLQVFFCC